MRGEEAKRCDRRFAGRVGRVREVDGVHAARQRGRAEEYTVKQIILNADDFGRHMCINRAVEQGVRDGVLRSATIMPGGMAFEDAAALAKSCPTLGVGIHLTLVNGVPVLPPAEIPSLVTGAGVFVEDHRAFVARLLRGAVRLEEVRAELAAQLRRVEGAGIHPTHADSHQHMHVLPGVIDITLALCCAAGIPAMRAPRAPLLAGKFGGIGQFIGRAGLAALAVRAAAKARRCGLVTTEHFAGIVAGEAIDTGTLAKIAAELGEGTTEIMLHPGTDNEALRRDCLWDHDFEAELAAVCAPVVRSALDKAGAVSVNFGDLTPLTQRCDK